MWLVHIDTWNYPDPQKIIDLVPQDIRPFVVMNISLSINHDDNDKFLRLGNGYETAKSWLRVCAENRMWAMIQQASGGYNHFGDDDLGVYEEFYRSYPNFIGFNYAEQFWGFNDPPLSPPWIDRITHFANLLELGDRYGGYLVVSWCGNQWSPSINPMAMLKRNPAFEQAARLYTKNFILCEKYTQQGYQHDMESLCLGAYLSGYSGQYGIRYDDTGWTDANGEAANFSSATNGAPHLEHVMLTGQTVIDGPELIWTECFRGLSDGPTTGGYTMRRWGTYPQFDNMSVDLFRKILDGTVRIPTREEVIERTKVVIVNDVDVGDADTIYSTPETLFDGLYLMDGSGSYENNKTFFKKTGRYPTIPTVYRLNDDFSQSFAVQVNRSAYSSRWPTQASKVAEFNSLFPSDYTGDIYAGRHENGWVVYNPYKTNQMATGNIPFRYNTCDAMELSLSQYSSGVVKEFADRVTFYLTNFDADNPALRTDTIKIFGSTSKPTWSRVDRGSQASTVTESWSGGVLTLTVAHNGPLDLTVHCSGTETNRLSDFTPATIEAPEPPMLYPGPAQYEGECFDFKSIDGIDWNAAPGSVVGFTGQGFLRLGTNGSAAVRDQVRVLSAGTYRLETRYSLAGSNVGSIDLYVNGSKVADLLFVQTGSNSEWAVDTRLVTLNAGFNTIEFRANGSSASSVYFDNIMLVPLVAGSGLVIQENESGFDGVDGVVEDIHPGYTGPGFANTDNFSGAGLGYTLDFDSSPVKAFTFRYAGTDDRLAELRVDGQVLTTGIVFPSTGGWDRWELLTVYASVPSGVREIRLEAVSAAGLPNIDFVEVTGGEIWQSGEVPFQPLNLTAAPLMDGSIHLSWSAAAGAETYEMLRSSTSGGPYQVVASGLGGTTFTDSALAELTSYHWVVRAINGAGPSEPSSETSATTGSSHPPVAPTGLMAVAAAFDQIDLSWTASPGAESYIVRRAESAGGPFMEVAAGLSGTTFQDDRVDAGTTYYYRVSGFNLYGEGAHAGPAVATTPTTYRVEPIADTFARDGGDAGSNFGNDTRLAVKNDGTSGSIFNRNTFLKFDVSKLGQANNVVLKLTPDQVDGSPNLAYEWVENDTWSEYGLNWNNQPAGSGEIFARRSSYSVGQEFSLNVTDLVRREAAGDGVLSIRITDPTTSGIYVGYHSRDASSPTVRPALEGQMPVGPLPPLPPSEFVASRVSGSSVGLKWRASHRAESYSVKRSLQPGGPYVILASGLTDARFVDPDVVEGVTYYYVVSAAHEVGESINSDEVMAVAGTLHAHLRFDDGAGTVAADASGRGREGSLIAGPVWEPEPNGRVRGAIRLGGGSHVTFAPGVMSGLSDFTIATWVHLDSVGGWTRIFDFGSGTQTNMFLTPMTGNSNLVRFAITNGGAGGEQRIDGTGPLPTQSWTHVAVTLQGGVGTLFVNGAAVGTNSGMALTPAALGATTQNYIGRSQYADPALDGRVDDFRIYAIALSSGEIAELASMPQASIQLTDLAVNYTGSPRSVSVVTDPRGLGVEVTYDGSSSPPVVPGAYPVAASILDDDYQSSTTGVLTILPRDYRSWIASAFTASGLQSGLGAPSVDPDQDGLENFMEYALGSDPMEASPLPEMAITDAQLMLLFERPAFLADVAYVAESSQDLVTWDEVSLEVLNPGSDPESVRAAETFLDGPPESRFIRLRASQQAPHSFNLAPTDP